MGERICHFCESGEQIEEHHILPQRFQGSDNDSNIVQLCTQCHWKLERLYNKDFYNALGIEDPRQSSETHLTCHMAQCQQKAVASYALLGTTGRGKGWYCAEHADEIDEEIKRKEETEGLIPDRDKIKDLRKLA